MGLPGQASRLKENDNRIGDKRFVEETRQCEEGPIPGHQGAQVHCHDQRRGTAQDSFN